MQGIVAHVPNSQPKFVPISTEILTCCATHLIANVRQALVAAIGLAEDTDFSLLLGERHLCSEDDESACLFKEKLEKSKICTVRVLFRLLGGKGGFGALLKKQGGNKKKTKNFDAMRDLTGRRIRHSSAVDRIKEWMEKNNREDELVDAIAGTGPEPAKPKAASESLDPEFVRKLKRSAKERPGVVTAGLRALEAAEAQEPAKRSRTDAVVGSSSSKSGGESSMKWLGMDSLGDFGSSSPGSPESEEGPDNEGEIDKKGAGASGSKSMPSNSGTVNSESLPEKSTPDQRKKQEEQEEDEEESDVEKADAKEEESSAAAAAPVRSRGRRGGSTAEPEADAGTDYAASTKCLGPEDLAKFKDAAQLSAKVSAETIKQSLQKLGLKCGGKPEDRAQRLFLLKGTPLKDLPKSAFAAK